ncbi:MAG: hypothetical protein L0H36_02175 [bacterium]|nr:hypothetical protein [bacterium]MDN5835422.1 hypothetical protein [bacterium]
MLESTYPIKWLKLDWRIRRWTLKNKSVFESLRSGQATQDMLNQYYPLDRATILAGVYGLSAQQLLSELTGMVGELNTHSLSLSSTRDDDPLRVLLSKNA